MRVEKRRDLDPSRIKLLCVVPYSLRLKTQRIKWYHNDNLIAEQKDDDFIYENSTYVLSLPTTSLKGSYMCLAVHKNEHEFRSRIRSFNDPPDPNLPFIVLGGVVGSIGGMFLAVCFYYYRRNVQSAKSSSSNGSSAKSSITNDSSDAKEIIIE